ncbi:MAG: DUF2892 domain-containing protein [Acidobacteriota bacterium]
MQANVGGFDRTFRIVGGLLVIAAGLYFKSWFGVIGVLLLLTGLFRCCPAYIPFGINTGKK